MTASFVYAQEPPENSALDELIELRLEFLEKDLSSENLFRLGSLYLVLGLYRNAADYYALAAKQLEKKLSPETRTMASIVYYNRGLALFSLKLYDSAKSMFKRSFENNDTLIDALRMLGTVFFIEKNKPETLKYWEQYLSLAPESMERSLIEEAVEKLKKTEFQFPEANDVLENQDNPAWPFLNPDTIPYPESYYQRKRVV